MDSVVVVRETPVHMINIHMPAAGCKRRKKRS